ncbi:chaplin [Streptomyces sp. NPDC020965]|uniref:chaplin n=1 Tax=Streptomyces sp. NPDC020965 TaxID=3365105 RepID=UPI00379D1E3B
MRQFTRKGLITMAAAGGAIALGGGGYAQADAGAHGGASHSPGVASGNSVQVPINVPVNACGNSVNVVGLLNPAFGNNCANTSAGARPLKPAQPGGSHAGSGSQAGPGSHTSPAVQPGATGGGAQATGGASHSPGVGSGNAVQAPVSVPVNACGNSVSVVGLLNPTFGNDCASVSSPVTPIGNPPVEPGTPGKPGPGKPGTGTPVKPGNPRTGGPDLPGEARTPGTPATPADDRSASDLAAQGDTRAEADDELAMTGTDSLGLIIPAGAGMLLAGAVLYRRARSAA